MIWEFEEIDARWLLDEILENMDDEDAVVVFRPEKNEEEK
jgi:hypothetical protein